jgi:hypothetical protein
MQSVEVRVDLPFPMTRSLSESQRVKIQRRQQI